MPETSAGLVNSKTKEFFLELLIVRSVIALKLIVMGRQVKAVNATFNLNCQQSFTETFDTIVIPSSNYLRTPIS
jgi:hypothetical protein